MALKGASPTLCNDISVARVDLNEVRHMKEQWFKLSLQFLVIRVLKRIRIQRVLMRMAIRLKRQRQLSIVLYHL